MDRFSVSEFSTLGWTFEEDVIRYGLAGFGAIGVWRQKYEDFVEDYATGVLHNNNLRVSSLSWAGGFTGNEGLSFDEAIDDSIDAIRMAATLNAGCLIVQPGSRRGHTANHAKRLFRRALQEIIPIADDFGVRLAVEPMCRHQANGFTFLHSWQEALEMIAGYAESSIGMVLDLFQYGHVLESLLETVTEHIDRLSLVQISDRTCVSSKTAHRCLPWQRHRTLGSMDQSAGGAGLRWLL